MVSYDYDPGGQRVKRTRLGVTMVYLGGGIVEEELGGGTRTLYQFGGQVLAQRSTADGVLYFHSDHLGSVSVVTSASGSVVSSQEFTLWGEVRSGGIEQTSVNFTGQRRDGTGLLFYNARYYDPKLARFVSRSG